MTEIPLPLPGPLGGEVSGGPPPATGSVTGIATITGSGVLGGPPLPVTGSVIGHATITGSGTLGGPPLPGSLPVQLPASLGGITVEPPPPPPPEPGDTTPGLTVKKTGPTELEELNAKLLHGDPVTAAMAADDLAVLKTSYDKDWIVTIYDFMWRPIGEFGDDILELVGTDPRNELPTATLKVSCTSQHIDALMNCKNTMVGILIETQGMRFPFYVDTFDWEFNNQQLIGTANLLGIWDILNYYQIWPDAFLPIQAQIFSHAIFIWALVTVVETMISECALRIQSGLWEFVNNALSLNPDISAWFGTLLQSNGNIFEMLKTPTYVVRSDPLLDTSPLVAKTVRMESCATTIKDVTRAYGVDVRVDLWLPGDDQPDQWANLDQPTYVVTVKDRMTISGPTKTVLDSVIGTVVDIGGSFFGEIPGIIDQVPGMDGVFFSPVVGQDFVEPWAVLIMPEYDRAGNLMQPGNVETCKVSFHTPKGWQHIIGGRSPKWLNDLFNAFFAWIIDSISILIGITGIPSNLLDGFLNNAFLAFQLIELYERRNEVGPYHPNIERFYPTASAPYNIETVFAFVNAIFDSRGYVSAQATFRNGVVYTLGKDVFRGGLMSVLYMGRTRLFTNYVTNTMFRLTQKERDVFVQIGDGKAEEAPLAKDQRFITGIIESLNVITLAPQS